MFNSLCFIHTILVVLCSIVLFSPGIVLLYHYHLLYPSIKLTPPLPPQQASGRWKSGACGSSAPPVSASVYSAPSASNVASGYSAPSASNSTSGYSAVYDGHSASTGQSASAGYSASAGHYASARHTGFLIKTKIEAQDNYILDDNTLEDFVHYTSMWASIKIEVEELFMGIKVKKEF